MCLGGFSYLERAAYDSTFGVSVLEKERAYRKLNPPPIAASSFSEKPMPKILTIDDAIAQGLMTKEEVDAFKNLFG